MLRFAGHTYAHHHNGNRAVRVHGPVQNGSGQDFGNRSAARRVFPTMSITGPGFGSGALSSFRSGRVSSLAIRMARGAAPNLPASLASLFNNLRNDRSDLSRLPVWRASRCLAGKEFLQRKHELLGGICASAGHRRHLSCVRSSSASTKARKAFHDGEKASHESGQSSQERSHV